MADWTHRTGNKQQQKHQRHGRGTGQTLEHRDAGETGPKGTRKSICRKLITGQETKTNEESKTKCKLGNTTGAQ